MSFPPPLSLHSPKYMCQLHKLKECIALIWTVNRPGLGSFHTSLLIVSSKLSAGLGTESFMQLPEQNRMLKFHRDDWCHWPDQDLLQLPPVFPFPHRKCSLLSVLEQVTENIPRNKQLKQKCSFLVENFPFKCLYKLLKPKHSHSVLSFNTNGARSSLLCTKAWRRQGHRALVTWCCLQGSPLWMRIQMLEGRREGESRNLFCSDFQLQPIKAFKAFSES